MKKYIHFILISAIIFIVSTSSISAIPSHENIDDALDDPRVLMSYFSLDLERIEKAMKELSNESFHESNITINNFNYHLRIPKQTILETESKNLDNDLLKSFFKPYDSIFRNLNLFNELQPELSEMITGLENEVYEVDLPLCLTARNLLSKLEHELTYLKGNIESLEGLYYDITEALESFSLLEDRILDYSNRVKSLEDENQLKPTYLFLNLKRMENESGIKLLINGIFSYKGQMISGSMVNIFMENEIIKSINTESGTFDYEYELPNEYIKNKKLTFFAQTYYNNEFFDSNIVEVFLEVPTILKLFYDNEVSEDHAELMFYGQLTDTFGNLLGDQEIKLKINENTHYLLTDGNGNFAYNALTLHQEDLSVTAYAEFAPPENTSYLRSISPMITFTLWKQNAMSSESLINKVLIFAPIFTVTLFVILYALRTKRRIEPALDITGKEPKSCYSKKTLEMELSILQKLGNFKEAVVLGYSRLLDYLEAVNIIRILPSTTHLDVHKNLKSIPESNKETNNITYTFELARYSNKKIDNVRQKSFFHSLKNIIDKIGGRD